MHVRQHGNRTITLTITLPAATGMEVLAAIDHFATRPGIRPDGERPTLAARRADALVAVAGAALAATDDQLATGRHRYLVHLHTGDDRQDAHPDGTDEEMAVGVSDATAERLCCDADEETVTHSHVTGEVIDVSNRGSVIRGRLRRLVRLCDRTCRVPGCGMRACKEIHHLHHRGRAEPTDSRTCSSSAATTISDCTKAAGAPNGSMTARFNSRFPTEGCCPQRRQLFPAPPKRWSRSHARRQMADADGKAITSTSTGH